MIIIQYYYIQVQSSRINNINYDNIESNMSTIDLGDCEKLLRKHYNLTNNQTIYMKKNRYNSRWNES